MTRVMIVVIAAPATTIVQPPARTVSTKPIPARVPMPARKKTRPTWRRTRFAL